jgi:hypothetical protein
VVDTNQIPELMSIKQLAQRLASLCATCAAPSLKRMPYLKVGRLVRFDTREVTESLLTQWRPPLGQDFGA